ncbi:MAG: hypothetical protein MHM6MM_006567 [Cercozoa sp. M6MM]
MLFVNESFGATFGASVLETADDSGAVSDVGGAAVAVVGGMIVAGLGGAAVWCLTRGRNVQTASVESESEPIELELEKEAVASKFESKVTEYDEVVESENENGPVEVENKLTEIDEIDGVLDRVLMNSNKNNNENNNNDAINKEVQQQQEQDDADSEENDNNQNDLVEIDDGLDEIDDDLAESETEENDLAESEIKKNDLVESETLENEPVESENVVEYKNDFVESETEESDLVKVESEENDLVKVQNEENDLAGSETKENELVEVQNENELVAVQNENELVETETELTETESEVVEGEDEIQVKKENEIADIKVVQVKKDLLESEALKTRNEAVREGARRRAKRVGAAKRASAAKRVLSALTSSLDLNKHGLSVYTVAGHNGHVRTDLPGETLSVIVFPTTVGGRGLKVARRVRRDLSRCDQFSRVRNFFKRGRLVVSCRFECQLKLQLVFVSCEMARRTKHKHAITGHVLDKLDKMCYGRFGSSARAYLRQVKSQPTVNGHLANKVRLLTRFGRQLLKIESKTMLL